MKGFRQQQQASRKDKLREMEVTLANSQAATRITQMMIQQLVQSNRRQSEDLARALGLINELQYKALAMQKLNNLDVTEMTKIANDLRLSDFNDASDKEDAEVGNAVGTTVNEDSIVILTSKTEGSDQGIFRSKIKLADCGVPDLIAAFQGREVGAKALVKLNDVEHEVELLGIRQPPKAEPVPQNVDVAVAGEPAAETAPAQQ